jgi:excinuclease ABC subunit C
VHRYAITFHRKSRKKDMTKSIFEEIPGMGKKRIQKLWQEFNSLEAIKDASLNELKEKTGFSEKLCEEIQKCSSQE